MKRPNSVVLIVAACALFFAGANQISAGQSEYYSRSGEGILRMKHSPALGINVPISVWINGRQAGVFAKGHVYERALAPGQNEIYAERAGFGRKFDSWYSVLDVRAGQTYSFVVKCTPNRVLLLPVSQIN